jgi:hypothetical protein
MQRALLVRAVLAACLLTLSTASLAAGAGLPVERGDSRTAPLQAPPIYQVTRYFVDGVYQQYETTGGFYSTGIGCVGPCSTSIQTAYSWSNSWSATISFKKEPVDATVGFNTSDGGSVSYTQTFQVPAGKSGVIWYADYYLVKNMYVHTETCWGAGGGCTYKYGTATARKWIKRLYSVRLS